MKSLVKIVLLLVLTASLSSCEGFKSIFDIEVDTELAGELDIVVEDQALKSTLSHPLVDEAIIDMLENDDIHEHQDKIDAFVLNSLVAKALEIDQLHPELGDVVIDSGTVFSISNADEYAEWELTEDWTILEESVKDLADLGTDNFETVESILLTMEPITIAVDGTVNQSGVSIVIELRLGTTVTANPL